MKKANFTGIRKIIKIIRVGDIGFKFSPWPIDKEVRFATKAKAVSWYDKDINQC